MEVRTGVQHGGVRVGRFRKEGEVGGRIPTVSVYSLSYRYCHCYHRLVTDSDAGLACLEVESAGSFLAVVNTRNPLLNSD